MRQTGYTFPAEGPGDVMSLGTAHSLSSQTLGGSTCLHLLLLDDHDAVLQAVILQSCLQGKARGCLQLSHTASQLLHLQEHSHSGQENS